MEKQWTEERVIFSTNCFGKTEYPYKKREKKTNFDPCLVSYPKNNLKLIIDLNVKPKTINLQKKTSIR